MIFEGTRAEILSLFCPHAKAVQIALLDAIALPECRRVDELLMLSEALRLGCFLIDWAVRFGASFVMDGGSWCLLLAAG